MGKDKPSKEKETKKSKLPEPLETQATRVICRAERNDHTSTVTTAHAYQALGIDNAYNLPDFKSQFDISITALSDESLSFDLIGVDPAIANALRRIMIAEVPTMAIEHVFIINNTSVIQDEVLAHRLGMVPIAADARLFSTRSAEDPAGETNTIVFKLHVKCERRGGGVVNDRVYSKDLQWLPNGSEIPEETSCRFTTPQNAVPPYAPVLDEILLARLAPGQEIMLEAHCTKGMGKEHAKWSPVATAWYRLLPEAVLLKPVTGAMAKELARELPGLITLKMTKESGRDVEEAVVHSARKFEILLEKFRAMSGEDKWRGVLELRKVKNHFMFTIESTGIIKPWDVFTMAIEELGRKCDKVLERL